jgi:hypothetical protein
VKIKGAKQLSLIREPLERIWYALSKEKIKELQIRGVVQVFAKALENKQFLVKNRKAKISLDELMAEPEKAALDLMKILKQLE